MKFTNLRRIKKVLNKFLILQKIRDNSELTERYRRHIPKIYTESSGNILETILVLYIIILHEFNQDKYEKLFDLKHKEYVIVKALKNRANTNTYNNYISTIAHYLNAGIINKEIKSIDFSNGGIYDHLVFTFLPDTLIEMESNNYQKSGFETMKFSEITIEHRFLKFLLRNGKIFMRKENRSEITLLELKSLVRSVL